MQSAYPITDEEAKNLEPYRFKITNTCNLGVSYDVNLEVLGKKDGTEGRLDSKNVAVEFNNGSKRILNSYTAGVKTYTDDAYEAVESYGLTGGTLSAHEEVSYTIKLWMDESVTATDEVMNKTFRSKISVTASIENQIVDSYKEEILNGTDPVLSGDLIPVRIADDGTVTKANTNEEWYNYTNKEWANAVILLDKTKEYNNYDIIPEENIESYFVWIPRYKYKIWDEGKYDNIDNTLLTADKLGMATSKAHQIELEFETKDVEASTGSTVNSWLTHPAFTAFDVNGLWVGKFETGYKEAANTREAEKNENSPTKVQIKPNVYSWRSIQIANAHLTSYNYQRGLDSHMMKNTEWGAIAYLQHSVYGSQTSVRIDNNSNYVTGYASINEPTCGFTGKNEACNQYGTTSDITVDYFSSLTDASGNKIVNLASTTGNKTGVFDMSGSAWEYVMGVMIDQDGNPVSGKHNIYNSGFNGTLTCPHCADSGLVIDKTITSVTGKTDFPDTKYYDKYAYGTNNKNYKARILGDATGEMGPFATAVYGTQNRQIGSWYDDEAWFVYSYNPWFARGGGYYHGLGAGVFEFRHEPGRGAAWIGFRVVLAP